MGRLYKRAGRWYADFYDRASVRRRESLNTKDIQVARARLRELELATTDRGPDQTEDLSAVLDYFTGVTCAGRSAGTIRCYEQKARHLGRLLGSRRIGSLTREDIERYVSTRLGEGAHQHTVHKELVVLRGALKSAKERGRFPGSLDVVPKFSSGYVPRTTYLTPEQFAAMIDALVPPLPRTALPSTLEARTARLMDRARYCMLIAYASPRRGEVEALRRDHVDLARGMIAIPKGKTVGRPVAIAPALRPWLEGLPPGPVVRPWHNTCRDMKRACERAGVPRCTPNDLRRTFASWLIQAGESNRIVADLLGHSSTRMVDLVYGKLSDATRVAAVAKLPACAAVVPPGLPRPGAIGTPGTRRRRSRSAVSVGNTVETGAYAVPRVGIEPTTRGFSVRCSTN